MQSLSKITNQKLRNSKFFEYFIKQYGERCTKDANDEDLFRNMRSFYTDLLYGNIQQDKYMRYLSLDDRILKVAINDCYQKLMSSIIVKEALEYSQQMQHPVSKYDQFVITINEAKARNFCYGILYNGLLNFINTGNPNYLIHISVEFNNPMNRNAKGVTL